MQWGKELGAPHVRGPARTRQSAKLMTAWLVQYRASSMRRDFFSSSVARPPANHPTSLRIVFV